MNEKVNLVLRVLFGVGLLFFGVSGLFQLGELPAMPEAALSLIGALVGSGYIFPIMNVVMILCGAALLVNKYVPLGLALLLPFTVNMVLFHVFLALSSIVMALVLLVLNVYFIHVHWDNFAGILEA